ncbi:MAG: hypothetical protein V3V00_10410 [Saprospiraceae bacterium]
MNEKEVIISLLEDVFHQADEKTKANIWNMNMLTDIDQKMDEHYSIKSKKLKNENI